MKKNLIGLVLIIAFAMILVACKEPHAHTFEEEWTTDGTNHWHAATCGCDVTDELEAHDWNITHKTLPNCTQTGIDTYTCSVCGYAEDRIVAKKHTWDTGVTAKFATCTDEGELIKHCTLCGEVATTDITIEKLSTHIWEDGSVSGNNVVFTCEHSGDHTNTVATPTGKKPNVFTESTKLNVLNVFMNSMETLAPSLTNLTPNDTNTMMILTDTPVKVTVDSVEYDCLLNGTMPMTDTPTEDINLAFTIEDYEPFSFVIDPMDLSLTLELVDKTSQFNRFSDINILGYQIPSELEGVLIPSIISSWETAIKPKKTSDNLYIRDVGSETEITMKGYTASGTGYNYTITGVIIVDSENKILSMCCNSFAYSNTSNVDNPITISPMQLEYSKEGSTQTFRVDGELLDNSRISFSV